METADYVKAINESLATLGLIRDQMDLLEADAAKYRQFFFAALNMLPDEQREKYMALFHEAIDRVSIRESSLKDAVLKVLTEGYPRYLTATDVRDRLVKAGFDFSGYASNPLASVHSTLKRLKTVEAEATTIQGVMVWRHKAAAPTRRFIRRRSLVPLSSMLGHPSAIPPAPTEGVLGRMTPPPGYTKKKE